MAYTGNDIIAGALRLISSLTPGEAINGQEASNALTVLNELLAAFSMEPGLINAVTIEGFPLTVGKTSYTMGSGGDFNTVRADSIFNQWLYDSASGIRYPIKQLSDNQYNSIPLNNIQSIPKSIYYDPQYPLGVVYIYPVAGLTTYSLYLESYKPIMQFTTLSTSMNLPAEYFKTLKLLLADELAPEYGYEIQPGSRLEKNIENARIMMKGKNFKRSVAAFDAGLGGRAIGGTILDGFIS
jgi:hypothetical protein